jgi:2-haloacid dehalogenase
MTEALRHIVFDIGKVLIHYDPDLPFARLIPDAEERAAFFATVCTPAWNLEQDRGRSWPEAEALLIAQFPRKEAHIRAFRRHWAEMVPHAYDDSVAILTALIDAGRDVTLLTNFAADTFVEARRLFPFLDLPRGVTVSGQIGLIKPERAIYERHAREFGLEPRHTLFIDDSAANVEGARAAGWQALHFTGAERLRADLAALGVEVAA